MNNSSPTLTTRIAPGAAIEQLLALVLVGFMLVPAATEAALNTPDSYFVSTASDKYSDTWQAAAGFSLPAPVRLRADRMELTVGAISTPLETRAVISVGPVWRWSLFRGRAFTEFGFSPTLISGAHFGGRDMGGNLHFTSAISVGSRLGSRQGPIVALRLQHTSNGGLNSSNPGMDMLGLTIHYNFGYDFDR